MQESFRDAIAVGEESIRMKVEGYSRMFADGCAQRRCRRQGLPRAREKFGYASPRLFLAPLGALSHMGDCAVARRCRQHEQRGYPRLKGRTTQRPFGVYSPS